MPLWQDGLGKHVSNNAEFTKLIAFIRLQVSKIHFELKYVLTFLGRHGTGHGVGHFLNVHEGPQGIGTRAGKMITMS